MMGEFVKLTAEDGHELSAYIAKAEGPVKGGLVLIQEIFGVNKHIQSVCDEYAREGYTTIAPAMFDRLQRDVELNYDQDGVQSGLALMNQIAPDVAMKDIAAAKKYIDDSGKVSVMGYCWGGALTFIAAASDINFFKAVGYYGGGIPRYIDLKPQIPVLLHFGEKDAAIPVEQVE
ncbi:MAG: dienelactone hydrolase family protein, partial [Sneathiella sp.]|nr:dienelactone hydrolase family protein [Sneathiella sp.]